jgi:hypothetical protein
VASDARPLLIHLHIPRNAGTTLGRILRLKLLMSPPTGLLSPRLTLGYFSLGGYENRLRRIEALPRRRRKRIRLFEAHAGWGLHELLPEPSIYLTMLREPVDRAVSVYWHRREGGTLPPQMTLGEYVCHGDVQRIWWVDNAQVRYLAGEGGRIVDVPVGRCTRTMLDVAAERLEQFAFVGASERFDASIVLLRRLLGWRGCRYVPANATGGRPRVDEIDVATLALLREHNELDSVLYRQALRRFEERVGALGEAFRRELALFSASNERYARGAGRALGVVLRGRALLRRGRARGPQPQ